MDADQARERIPDYLDNQLSPKELFIFEELMVVDAGLREEVRLHQKTWQLLTEAPLVDPDPGFESRFYTRLANESKSSVASWRWLPQGLFGIQWAPVAVVLSVVIVLVVWQIGFFSDKGMNLAKVSEEDLGVIENIELVENFDVIENLDFWLDLERMADESPSSS